VVSHLAPYDGAMAIVGLGLDLAPIARIEAFVERFGQRGLDRLFTAREQAYCERKKERFASYAGRFAVKEAVMKLLGTGWTNGVRWVDIEVVRENGRAPRAVLHGQCARLAELQRIARIHISITHDGGISAAVAVAEAD
jgi:holo-[acyl-carrier protein] synthase